MAKNNALAKRPAKAVDAEKKMRQMSSMKTRECRRRRSTRPAPASAPRAHPRAAPAPPLAVPKSLIVTVNLHKRCHGVTFKKKAARAVKEIKKFAASTMSTKDVRVDQNLNKFVWSKGVRNVPYRVRVKLTRKRNPDEGAEEKMYTLAEYVAGPEKGQITVKTNVAEEE